MGPSSHEPATSLGVARRQGYRVEELVQTIASVR
jgi:hypothetical protein